MRKMFSKLRKLVVVSAPTLTDVPPLLMTATHTFRRERRGSVGGGAISLPHSTRNANKGNFCVPHKLPQMQWRL